MYSPVVGITAAVAMLRQSIADTRRAVHLQQKERNMGVFRIQPHGRLHEWVAEEKGYFRAEGLEYEFVRAAEVYRPTVQSAETASVEVKTGAFESMEAGRSCEVSSACHWAVNMATSAEHGKMYGKAYSIGLAGIYVPPESPIRRAEDLAGVEVGLVTIPAATSQRFRRSTVSCLRKT
jgi:hypothetical protein